MGDPGIDAIKLHGCTFDALLGIVGTEDFEETAFFWKALVSRDDTEDWTAFLAFLTETDDNCHDTGTGMGSGFGEAHGGDFEKEIKQYFQTALLVIHDHVPDNYTAGWDKSVCLPMNLESNSGS